MILPWLVSYLLRRLAAQLTGCCGDYRPANGYIFERHACSPMAQLHLPLADQGLALLGL
jgi:hypothetical protein